MKKLIIRNLTTAEGSTMPVLEIKYVNDEGQEKIGYLAPFRGYKFQVSKTNDGEWDLSSSEVVGLANIILATIAPLPERSNLSIYSSNVRYVNGGAARTIFKSMVMETISKLAYRYESIPAIDYEAETKIIEFVYLTYNYILDRMGPDYSTIERASFSDY